MGRLLLGVVLGIVLVPLAVMVWFHFGNPPVAVADKPFPMEKQITGIPLHARMDKEMVKTPPVQADETAFVAGAEIYRDQCAACHGYHGKPSSFGGQMFPRAPQLWEKHRNGNVVGVSDDPPGETYWRVANGIRLTGMPSYKKILSDTQMWQVTLLLANADKPLPPGVVDVVSGKTAAQAIQKGRAAALAPLRGQEETLTVVISKPAVVDFRIPFEPRSVRLGWVVVAACDNVSIREDRQS